MAKKTTRSAKSKTTAKQANQPIVEVQSNEADASPGLPPRAPRPPKLNRSQAASERLEDEYGFIAGDLWRVFILAAVMFALLIALNVAFNFIG